MLLEMRHITKRFPGVLALHDVSFSIEHGEIFAIMGENGAGKSTLMKILSGAYPCHSYEGSILIEGQRQVFHTPRDAENAGIGMIYQEINHVLDLSLAENIFMGNLPAARWGRVHWGALYEQTRELLTKVGLNLDPRLKIRNLNISQQQMLSIAKALARKTKILILDEPTSALTKSEVIFLFRIMNDLKRNEISCIYISHKLEEVFTVSDRIMVIRDGEIQTIMTRDRSDKNELVRLMIGRNVEKYERPSERRIGGIVMQVKNLKIPHPFVKKRLLLHDISFDLRSGEVLGIAGLVGSGRSELVNGIMGFKKPYLGGEVVIGGRYVTIRSPMDAKKYGLALVGEDRRANGFVGLMNLVENITLAGLRQFATPLSIDKSAEYQSACKFSRKLNIKATDPHVKLYTLSGGNQQKVVISKWLMTEPKVLILDDPTRGIDVAAKYEIYRIIEHLANQAIGVILISSEMQEILYLCDRCIVLRHGSIHREFNRAELSEETLYLAMTGFTC